MLLIPKSWTDKKVYNAGSAIICSNPECNNYVRDDNEYCDICTLRNEKNQAELEEYEDDA